MTVAHRFREISPQTRHQKQYLAILKLYSECDIVRICHVLNCKFEDSLFRKRSEIDINLTRDLWNEMETQHDEVVVWAEQQGADSWRVKRVLAYAEAHPTNDGLGMGT